MNKGRDFYRAQQDWAKTARNRRTRPWPIGEQEFEVRVGKKTVIKKMQVVGLSDRQYRVENRGGTLVLVSKIDTIGADLT